MSSDSPAKENRKKQDNPSDHDGSRPMAGQSEVPDFVSEDVYRFWKQHGTRIMVYSGVILAAFLGTQIWNYLATNRESSLMAEFASLTSEEERLEFAGRHSRKGIAGFAFLDAAGNATQEMRYEDALDHYRDALRALRGLPLEGLALLGKASVLDQMERRDEAERVLASVSEDKRFAKGLRVEALYHRTVLAFVDGQTDKAETLALALEAMDDMGFWMQRLEIYRNYQ